MNKSLAERVMQLQGTVPNKKGARKIIQKEMVQVEGSVAAFEELSAPFSESKKLLLIVREDVELLRQRFPYRHR